MFRIFRYEAKLSYTLVSVGDLFFDFCFLVLKNPKMEPHRTIIVKSGSRLYLRCAVAANPEPEWTWKKDGKVIQSSGNVFEKDDVDNNDAGSYMCVAKNRKGQTSDTQHIAVFGKLQAEIESSDDIC